jgi:predicted RNase H-like HicB family nuclease
MNASKYELIVYWSAEDTVFVADVPELPGCMVDGPTPAYAEAQAQEVIALWVDTAREDGRAGADGPSANSGVAPPNKCCS